MKKMRNIPDSLLNFAAKIIELGRKLNKTYEGRHVYGQLFRAGSSAGANYEESQSAESNKDFIHKLQLVLKELKESRYWLRLIKKARLISPDDVTLVFLLQEVEELIRIIAKSIITAKKNKNKP